MPTACHSPRRFVIVDDHTIQETRDRQEERRPRKRQRVESDEEDQAQPSPARKVKGTPKKKTPGPIFAYASFTKDIPERDETFFSLDPGATCHVRVGDVLFKIHPHLLSCSPFMEQFFMDHIDEHGPTTPDRPLKLVAPSIDEYRAFLWALYATPEELSEPPTEHPQLKRLFLIKSLTTKYDTEKLKVWVAVAIFNAANNSVFMDSCSSATLTEFVEVAIEHNFDDTLQVIIKKWCERLLGKSTPSVPAIQIADTYAQELRELRGVAYYVHVQDMMDRQTKFTESGATQLHADPKLNNGQVMRLLAGSWSLVSLWERLRLKPIELPQAASCSDETHAKCTATWERRWISAAGWKRILGHNSADILTLLSCLQDQLSNDDDLKAGMNADCRRVGLDGIKQLRQKTQDGLTDHFSGVV